MSGSKPLHEAMARSLMLGRSQALAVWFCRLVGEFLDILQDGNWIITKE
jgi:hypothetical protein